MPSPVGDGEEIVELYELKQQLSDLQHRVSTDFDHQSKSITALIQDQRGINTKLVEHEKYQIKEAGELKLALQALTTRIEKLEDDTSALKKIGIGILGMLGSIFVALVSVFARGWFFP